MDMKLLEDIGLSENQALAYENLVIEGPSSAPQVAMQIGESRTNTYKLLDKLCDLGLAVKDASGTKVRYIALSPSALEQLIQKQAASVRLREQQLQSALPSLLDFFFSHSEGPSIRYFQGKEGIQQIFADMLKTREDIYLLRSPSDVDYYDEQFFADFRKKRALLGIHTYALTPDVPTAVHNRQQDTKNLFHRTWLDKNAYTGQVEWDIYGNKVALICYGQSALGVVIENPLIAESFKQMFGLVQAGSARISKGMPSDDSNDS
jgi:sugar-specific transcriptional regulator TrmB